MIHIPNSVDLETVLSHTTMLFYTNYQYRKPCLLFMALSALLSSWVHAYYTPSLS